MKKALYILLSLLGLLTIVYLLGPTPESPIYRSDLPLVPTIDEIENYIASKEAKHDLRKGTEAKIVWADSSQQHTEYAILYLHGFSSSHPEGFPVHQNVAEYFGANLFLSRLHEHGVVSDTNLHNYTAEEVWKSAQEALMITHSLGKKVIIVSTSTGGTLALKLAADYPDKVSALVNLSPNIRLKDPAAPLLNNPWGEEIASIVFGEQRKLKYEGEEAQRYWDTLYSVRALVQLQELLETTMNPELFKKIRCPILTLYYYKDQENQDQVIDVEAVAEMHELVATPDSLHLHKALPNSGGHVIASMYATSDHSSAEKEIKEFCKEVLQMVPIER